MAAELDLDRLQRWVHAVIVHPGSPQQAVASDTAQREVPLSQLGAVILPSATLTPTERLAIYQGMYPLRMEEALAADYPALQHFLGEDAFLELVKQYVAVHPSRSFSLNPLGESLPEFLRTLPGLRRREFCHELATLELAVAQVFDAPETTPLGEPEVASIAPEQWERARLTPIAGFRVLAFRYPVNAYLQSVRDDRHDHPRPRLGREWVVVYRRDYKVFRQPLTGPAHDLLKDLAAGLPLGQAVAAALERGRRAPEEREISGWFQTWMQERMFAAVATS